jgi:hypothetical protein
MNAGILRLLLNRVVATSAHRARGLDARGSGSRASVADLGRTVDNEGVGMANGAEWRSRILSAARDAKQGAIAAAKHADALMRVAREEVKTAARHRKVRRMLRQASRVLKSAGKAALTAGAAAAMAAVAREMRSQKRRRG